LYSCCGTGLQKARSFLTKEEERIKLLKKYTDELNKETQGVSERIKELNEMI
jgi:hypothetical protein